MLAIETYCAEDVYATYSFTSAETCSDAVTDYCTGWDTWDWYTTAAECCAEYFEYLSYELNDYDKFMKGFDVKDWEDSIEFEIWTKLEECHGDWMTQEEKVGDCDKFLLNLLEDRFKTTLTGNAVAIKASDPDFIKHLEAALVHAYLHDDFASVFDLGALLRGGTDIPQWGQIMEDYQAEKATIKKDVKKDNYSVFDWLFSKYKRQDEFDKEFLDFMYEDWPECSEYEMGGEWFGMGYFGTYDDEALYPGFEELELTYIRVKAVFWEWWMIYSEFGEELGLDTGDLKAYNPKDHDKATNDKLLKDWARAEDETWYYDHKEGAFWDLEDEEDREYLEDNDDYDPSYKWWEDEDYLYYDDDYYYDEDYPEDYPTDRRVLKTAGPDVEGMDEEFAGVGKVGYGAKGSGEEAWRENEKHDFVTCWGPGGPGKGKL